MTRPPRFYCLMLVALTVPLGVARGSLLNPFDFAAQGSVSNFYRIINSKMYDVNNNVIATAVQSGGYDVFCFQSATLFGDNQNIEGPRPVAILSRTDLSIDQYSLNGANVGQTYMNPGVTDPAGTGGGGGSPGGAPGGGSNGGLPGSGGASGAAGGYSIGGGGSNNPGGPFSTAPGYGGVGGGSLQLVATGNLVVGSLSAIGGVGSPAQGMSYGGGAGGGGGLFVLAGNSVTINGSVSVAGGNGGGAGIRGGGGGGGGGGVIDITAYSTYALSSAGSLVVRGGAGGGFATDPGYPNGTAAQAGTTGHVVLHGVAAPEPTSSALLATGLVAVAWTHLRRGRGFRSAQVD